MRIAIVSRFFVECTRPWPIQRRLWRDRDDPRAFDAARNPAGERLLLQIEFANSLFGAPFETVTMDDQLDGEFVRTVREFPYTFQLFRPRKGRQVMQ